MKKYIFSILFIIFLSVTIFSCKKDLLPEEEIVGAVRSILSPRGSFASVLVLRRPEKANGTVYYDGHVYNKGQTYYKYYYFDEFDKKTTEEFSKYLYKIIRVKAHITNDVYLFLINPKLIEVKDIDYFEISQEDWTNADSYIWK